MNFVPPLSPPQSDFMSLDALGALGDTLAAAEPTPELPKLKPEDIVSVGAQTTQTLQTNDQVSSSNQEMSHLFFFFPFHRRES